MEQPIPLPRWQKMPQAVFASHDSYWARQSGQVAMLLTVPP
jgi:hypothetical protein